MTVAIVSGINPHLMYGRLLPQFHGDKRINNKMYRSGCCPVAQE